MVVEVAYRLNDYELISHVAQSPFRLGDGYPLLIPFSTAANNFKSMVLASYDGHTWFEVWSSKSEYAVSGAGARFAVGPTISGEYVITGGDSVGDFNVNLDTTEPSLISSLARVSKY